MSPSEPRRPADAARLNLAKIRIEDGISLETAFKRVTETAAVVLDVERVGIWLFIDERKSLRCVDLFECSKATHSAGVTLQTKEFPEYFAALESRRSIPAEVAVTDPRTSRLAEAYLVPLGITSMLDAPIYVAGEVIGVLCHEHVGSPREWTTEQRDFASAMADMLSLKIRAAEAEELRSALRLQAAQLAETQRLNELAETAAGVAHDFNNILTVMLGSAQVIAGDPGCPPPLAELARHIVAAGERGIALAKSLTEYALPGPHSSRVIRPAELVANQLGLLQSAVGRSFPIGLTIRSDAGRVMIDAHQLDRALLNLVLNSRDALPNAGPIHVAVDTVSDLDETGKPGQFVLIEVRDSGTGIEPAVLGRIFDPFFTTKPRGKGTGVGLAVVQQVVRYAGGFIRVESTLNKGTTFRVYLPCVSNS